MTGKDMEKVCFFTIDLESFYDSMCLYSKKIKYDANYSYESGLNNYLDLLNKYDVKATIFSLVSSLDNSKDMLTNALNNNHEIALHGLNHDSPLDLDIDTFINNTKLAKEQLEKALNTNIKGFRAPCFGINDEIIEKLKEIGFKYDSSSFNFSLAMKSGKVNIDNYNKINSEIYEKDNFYEFQLAKVKAYNGHIPVSGGGYIRLVPWFVIKYYIKKYLKHNNSYVFYCHPFELIKNKLPKIDSLNWKEKLFLKIGRSSFLKKIEWLIKYLKKKGFTFKRMSDVIS